MSVSQIHELRKRSNQFVQDLDKHIAIVVEHNKELIELNQKQLQQSKTAKGGALINNRTGSANLSPAYAKRKGKKKPDLFDTGAMYKNMDLFLPSPDEYLILSGVDHFKFLREQYEDAFGVGDKNKAYKITVPLLAKEYERNVLK